MNGVPAKPARDVNPGDTLQTRARIVRILALSTTRGPAPVARALYQDLTPEPEPPLAPRDGGRPTKRDRRTLDRLRDR